jgi:hypothetical protein
MLVGLAISVTRDLLVTEWGKDFRRSDGCRTGGAFRFSPQGKMP